MTALELIEETVAYYEEDPTSRATDGYTCFYQMEDGRTCAVGRCQRSEVRAGLVCSFDMLSLASGEAQFTHAEREELFQDKYKGFPAELWCDLQIYHDRPSYWEVIYAHADHDRAEYVKQLKEKWKDVTNGQG